MDDDLQHPPGPSRGCSPSSTTASTSATRTTWIASIRCGSDSAAPSTIVRRRAAGQARAACTSAPSRRCSATSRASCCATTARLAYVDGLILDVTRHITTVDIEHGAAPCGARATTTWPSLWLWLKMATSFSVYPLRLMAAGGFSARVHEWRVRRRRRLYKLLHPEIPAGWTSLIATILFVGGIQMSGLGSLASTSAGLPEAQSQAAIRRAHHNVRPMTPSPPTPSSTALRATTTACLRSRFLATGKTTSLRGIQGRRGRVDWAIASPREFSTSAAASGAASSTSRSPSRKANSRASIPRACRWRRPSRGRPTPRWSATRLPCPRAVSTSCSWRTCSITFPRRHRKCWRTAPTVAQGGSLWMLEHNRRNFVTRACSMHAPSIATPRCCGARRRSRCAAAGVTRARAAYTFSCLRQYRLAAPPACFGVAASRGAVRVRFTA